MPATGNLCQIQGKKTFEWKIKDFLLLKDALEEGHSSPQFFFSGASWIIKIYPYGKRNDESVGYTSLYLRLMSFHKPITVNYSFSFKTLNEENEYKLTQTRYFDKEKGWGWPTFILRSSLIEKKEDLLPSGTLTIICNLQNSETKVITAKDICRDAAAQTEEGTGVWKLQQHLREISLNGDISDVILNVENQEFKSHRCILAARSPVFSAMMKTEMKENVTGVVEIPDVDRETFSDFINYLYTGSTEDLNSENVAKLYVAADKYQVEVLKEDCLDHMLENVSIENFCDIFILSVQHNEEKLKELCIQYFAKHSLDIIETCKWQSFLCENPIICNELHIKLLKLNKVNH